MAAASRQLTEWTDCQLSIPDVREPAVAAVSGLAIRHREAS
jgi:hypothetical protein